MLGTDFILRTLAADGIDHLFMVPGGLVDPFLPALGRVPALTPVVAAHEGGAAYMADGYARASGKFGACLCIGGPGVTNTVTAISAAQADMSPVLVMSGEVSNFAQGLGLFQDATAGTFNDSLVLAPVTAESFSVPDVRALPRALSGAVKKMLDGARVPVHLSIPHDVQTLEVEAEPIPLASSILASEPLDVSAATALLGLLAKSGPAPKVALLVGGGVIADDAAAALAEVAERFQLPVATTEHSKGLLAEDHTLSLGVFGYAGTQHATKALLDPDLDLLIVLGATLNVRDSMYWSDKLKPRLGIASVNISALHVGCHEGAETYVGGHGGAFLAWLASADERLAAPLSAGAAARRAWIAEVKASPRFYDAANMESGQQPIHPARMMREVRKAMPRDTIALVDSGAHRAFAVHYWESYGPRTFLTASGLGPMGWAIPAGVGAKAARPDAPVVVFTGDGCMRMHGMEVQSAARNGLPVIYVVSNNQALGNVWLRVHDEGPVPAHITEAPDQDWAAFGRALGADGATVHHPDEIGAAVVAALASGRTTVIDVKTDRAAKTPIEPYSAAGAAYSYHA